MRRVEGWAGRMGLRRRGKELRFGPGQAREEEGVGLCVPVPPLGSQE